MCGRTELGVDVESIQARFHLYRWLHPEQFRPNYNVAPTQTQPTLIWDSQSGERLIQNMQWGITKYNQKAIIINIRDDTIRSKPIVGEKYKRCVVLARGYYEWKHQDKHRIPYYIHRADQSIMLLAGLYTETLNNDEINYTYVIVTTNAANDISGLHERMPVVLDDPSEWLSGQKDWLKKLCPFDGQLAWYPVSQKVNHTSNHGVECIKPIDEAANGIKQYFSQASAVDQLNKNKTSTTASPNSGGSSTNASPKPKAKSSSTKGKASKPSRTSKSTPYTRPMTAYFKPKNTK